MLKLNKETHTYYDEKQPNGKWISVTELISKMGLTPDYSKVDPELLNKSAEHGRFIHAEIENYIKTNKVGDTTETCNFATHLIVHNVKVLQSEFIVHNDLVAGTVDLLLEQDGALIIADIKTTSRLHKDSVSWQLSLYNYLNGWLATKAQVFRFDKNGGLTVSDITLKPRADIEKLIDAYRNGETTFQQELKGINPYQLEQLADAEEIIVRFETLKKQAEADAKEMRQAIMQAMEDNAVKTFENDRLRLTYIAPATRTSIDTARLRKEKPEIANEYSRTSQTRASLRITLRGDK